MRRRIVAGLAWSTWVLAALGLGLALWLRQLNGPAMVVYTERLAGGVVLALAYPALGALIASRRPGNAIGWIFCTTGLSAALQLFSEQYAVYALITRSGALPAGAVLYWLATWQWLPGSFVLVFAALLFPDGRLPSPRWRPVGWLAAGGMAIAGIAAALTPWDMLAFDLPTLPAAIKNPLAVESAAGFLPAVIQVGALLLLLSLLAAAVSLIVRFRGATGERRQQLKWVAYGVAMTAVLFVSDFLVHTPLDEVLVLVAVAAIPVTTGIAVLRYRLYDVDVVINRTLVYGTLTASLVLLYWGSVVLLQGLLRTLTGQDSDLAIVASTLAIAALFQPLRRCLQGAIDRRFYRRKYDAARTLAAFGVAVRDEVDLDQLTGRLIGVVEETMQPAHVSLWLPTPTPNRRPGARRPMT